VADEVEGVGTLDEEPTFDIQIRAAALTDLDACAEIYKSCQDEIFPGRLEAWTWDGFAIATAGEEILVAVASEHGGPSIVGFMSLWRADALVHFLHVRADRRRRGVGRTLLQAALAILPGSAELKCAIDNQGALAFYARLGWVETERKTDGSEPFVRLRYTRRVAAASDARGYQMSDD
jgi:ribosomal protein S18 acetylase RimI-like enzyme